ncbi:DDE-type integrase/transposase/recombinase [Candidatus Poribacteria bacterium]|nr:DDE-type integrase/transposase/recombinase [Candidatus Poribacteria bacterium]
MRGYLKTTLSNHHLGKYPNLIKDIQIVRPNQVWCGDITYIRLKREYAYLAVLMDVFTRSIRGWEISGSLDEQLTISALHKALSSYSSAEIHHSDQGVQYASKRDKDKHGIKGSTSAECICGEADKDVEGGRSLSQRV